MTRTRAYALGVLMAAIAFSLDVAVMTMISIAVVFFIIDIVAEVTGV